MLTKPLLALILAACGVSTTPAAADPPAEQPDKKPPDGEAEPIEQHFCCQSVDPKTMSGDGCNLIDKAFAPACDKLLYCAGNYAKDGGKVWCE